ncbi:hypothetical protein LJC27_07235 [Christensenellaceae bacterium OttesenSCG-928-M15]|nr:hypothetical protein [Christensenellaceae bacterium OttesenSCG-928-M15]
MKQIVTIIPFADEPHSLLREYFLSKRAALLKLGSAHTFLFVDDRGYLNDPARKHLFQTVFAGMQNVCCIAGRYENSVKGGAVYTGLMEAVRLFPGAIIGYTDVDDSLNLLFAYKKLRGNIPVNIAVRKNRAKKDRACSLLYMFFVKLLFPKLSPITDLQAGFKFFSAAFLADYFSNHEIRDVGFSFDMDLILYALEHEYPIRQFLAEWRENEEYTSRTFKNTANAVYMVFKKRFTKNGPLYRF